jgi:hypothetical protein
MRPRRQSLSVEAVDQTVISQVDDDASWGKPVKVTRQRSASLSLPAVLASRAAFFARLHHEVSLENWIKRIIAERLDIEEAAFAGCKRELSARKSRKQPRDSCEPRMGS